MSNVAISDDALVAEVLNGNRDAFGQLVGRYQSAVCGLAYSACGNISQSEDLAQETFIIAWRKLGELKQPTKFKSWLYGIARNLVNSTSRKQTRDPLAAAEPLDESLATTMVPNPAGQAITREEEGILWRSLEHIPEAYREPLILFYREHQSIERVAAILELSEEAARQRLSRGRKLLHERVIAFVEGALQQTAPGPLFALGVLAALPAMSLSAKAATFGAAAKGGTLATGASLAGFFSKFLGPLFPFVGMLAAYRQMKKAGFPDRALKSIKKFYIAIAISVVLMIGVVSALVDHGAAIVKTSPVLFVLVSVGLILGYFLVIGFFAMRHVRVVREAAATELAAGNLKMAGSCGSVWEYRARFEFLGLPLIHIRRGWRMDIPGMSGHSWKPVKAWIAISDSFAIGGLFAYGSLAIAPVSIGAISIGALSYGALVFGALAWGGFSFGVWAFGAFTFGWEAFSGGSAVAWHLAWGYQYAIAHDYALGAGTVHAAQANTPYVDKLVRSTWGHDFATALIPYFYWLMWAWAIPIMVSMVANWFSIGRRRQISTPTTR